MQIGSILTAELLQLQNFKYGVEEGEEAAFKNIHLPG
jgi:hypothetical protein